MDKLLNLIRNISVARMRQHSQLSSMQIVNIVQPNTMVFSHWMSIILVAGPSTTITFKTHFKTIAAQSLAARSYDLDPENISLERAIDFMREFCNLTAGGIKAALLNQQIQTAISLPIVTRGFDEIFFSEFLPNKSFTDQWMVHFKEGEVICSVIVTPLKNFDFTKIDVNFNETSDSEIELF